MSEHESTCWTVIRGAANGSAGDRDEFVRRYGPVIRAYLASRWRGTRQAQEIEDVVQDVFLDCFRSGGAVGRADPGHGGGFRAYLFGVVRNVALRAERAQARDRLRPGAEDWDPDARSRDEPGPSTLFDRAWAASVLREAGRRMEERAALGDDDSRRRVEMLRLRFGEGLPIREIAERWHVDPARLHHAYARAREEFRAALLEVVAFHHPADPGEVAREAERLLDLFR